MLCCISYQIKWRRPVWVQKIFPSINHSLRVWKKRLRGAISPPLSHLFGSIFKPLLADLNLHHQSPPFLARFCVNTSSSQQAPGSWETSKAGPSGLWPRLREKATPEKQHLLLLLSATQDRDGSSKPEQKPNFKKSKTNMSSKLDSGFPLSLISTWVIVSASLSASSYKLWILEKHPRLQKQKTVRKLLKIHVTFEKSNSHQAKTGFQVRLL